MDRDAAPASPATSAAALAEVVPPVEWAVVRKIELAGVALIAVAAALGLADAPPEWSGHLVRVLLVLMGAITVGSAVSMRPDLWPAWALGVGGAILAVAGTPSHWDSFRLLFGGLALVALTATAICAVPARYRLPAVSAIILFHFTGIVLATTTPPTGNFMWPWVTEQAFIRIFNPYLQFIYMRNAYHFYSPEPGPASVLVFLVKTENGLDPKTGKMQYTTQWVVMPKRPGDVKDPLGLTYYRRLSLSEQLARGTPGRPSFEAKEVYGRRNLYSSAIPKHPSIQEELQYQLPQPEIARFVLPSYASHVILESTPDAAAAAKTTVKIYRMMHVTMSVEEFIGVNAWKRQGASTNPYHPMTYRPYFLGEFNVQGDLVHEQDPMLYWLVPISPRMGGVPPGDPTKRDFLAICRSTVLGPDGLGPETTVDDLGDPKFKGRVFDWSQLR